MIDLRNTCILVKTKEENEMILKEAEKQGFHWHSKDNCKPLPGQHFPDILKLYTNKDITYAAYINPDFTFYEASELLGTKEMTVREFIERIVDICSCIGSWRECSQCEFDANNTKCKKDLCNVGNWKNNIDEILEIAKAGRTTIFTPEEKEINTLEKFIKNPDHTVLNDEFIESLKLAVEKVKRGEADGEINTDN